MALIIGSVKYLTSEEVAEMLQLDPVTVRNKMRLGQLPGHKFGGRWFVSEERIIEAFKESEREQLNKNRQD